MNEIATYVRTGDDGVVLARLRLVCQAVEQGPLDDTGFFALHVDQVAKNGGRRRRVGRADQNGGGVLQPPRLGVAGAGVGSDAGPGGSHQSHTAKFGQSNERANVTNLKHLEHTVSSAGW